MIEFDIFCKKIIEMYNLVIKHTLTAMKRRAIFLNSDYAALFVTLRNKINKEEF